MRGLKQTNRCSISWGIVLLLSGIVVLCLQTFFIGNLKDFFPNTNTKSHENLGSYSDTNVTHVDINSGEPKSDDETKPKVPKPKINEQPHIEFLNGDAFFVGSHEWYDLWTYASPSQREDTANHHKHDDDAVLQVKLTKNATMQHLSRIKSRYDGVDALADFYARGLGWIFDRLGMALTSFAVIGESSDNSTPGVSSVFIVDTLGKITCGGDGDRWMDRQPPLTMWVRVTGPEIFSGTAIPHRLKSSSLCTWRYSFTPKFAGEYSYDVKLLTFHGTANFDTAKCQHETIEIANASLLETEDVGDLEEMSYQMVQELAASGNFSHHRGISGFKFYGE